MAPLIRRCWSRPLRALAALALLLIPSRAHALCAVGNLRPLGPDPAATATVGGDLIDPSGSKPESKLWFQGGLWWATMWNHAGGDHYDIFKLTDPQTASWTSTGVTLPGANLNTRFDTLWDQSTGYLYIAAHQFKDSTTTNKALPCGTPVCPLRLHRYQADPSTAYVLNFTVPIPTNPPPLPPDVSDLQTETLVIAKGTNGLLWATWTSNGQVWVSHTNGPCASVDGTDCTWSSTPIDLLAKVHLAPGTPDEISSVIALDTPATGPAIGIMWSNEADGTLAPDPRETMFFAYHKDADDDATWSREFAYGGNTTKGADDHINLKFLPLPDGRVFAAVKTSKTSGTPLQHLLVRNRCLGGTGVCGTTNGTCVGRPGTVCGCDTDCGATCTANGPCGLGTGKCIGTGLACGCAADCIFSCPSGNGTCGSDTGTCPGTVPQVKCGCDSACGSATPWSDYIFGSFRDDHSRGIVILDTDNQCAHMIADWSIRRCVNTAGSCADRCDKGNDCNRCKSNGRCTGDAAVTCASDADCNKCLPSGVCTANPSFLCSSNADCTKCLPSGKCALDASVSCMLDADCANTGVPCVNKKQIVEKTVPLDSMGDFQTAVKHCDTTIAQACQMDTDCQAPVCPTCKAGERCLDEGVHILEACTDSFNNPSSFKDNWKSTTTPLVVLVSEDTGDLDQGGGRTYWHFTETVLCADDGKACTDDVYDGTACMHPLSSSTKVCRPAAGPCDVAEKCTGTGALCPIDTFKPSTEICRLPVDDCDVLERCTGSSPTCPGDSKQPDGTACTAGSDQCSHVCIGGTCAQDSCDVNRECGFCGAGGQCSMVMNACTCTGIATCPASGWTALTSSSNGQWLFRDGANGSYVKQASSYQGVESNLRILDLSGGWVAIQVQSSGATAGRYWTVVGGVKATATAIGPNEKFLLHDQGGGYISLTDINGNALLTIYGFVVSAGPPFTPEPFLVHCMP